MTSSEQATTHSELKRKVFVVNNSGYPYEKLEQYGEIIFLTQGSINHNRLNASIKKMGNLLATSSEQDYLCISGNNFLCALATAIWGNMHGMCTFLNWNPIKKDYEKYNIMLRNGPQTE